MGGCAAVKCTNCNVKKIRVFRFPRNPDRRKIWAINCRRGGEWSPTNSSVLCEAHFENNQFELNRADGRKLLKWNAVPTIFNVPNPPKKIDTSRRSTYKTSNKKERNVLDDNSNCPDQEFISLTASFSESENLLLKCNISGCSQTCTHQSLIDKYESEIRNLKNEAADCRKQMSSALLQQL